TFSSKKSFSVWKKYIDCMMNGFTVRKSAEICGINKDTAFIWRHKILDALQNMQAEVTLEGIVEADEAFFPISYKGNHKKSVIFKMPRKAHKRGKQTHKRGLSREKVCVPCAVTRNGLSLEKVTNLGRVSANALHKAFDNRIVSNSVLCTDDMNSYVDLAKTNELELILLKTGKSKLGIYHIQYINSYHSMLKNFINRFHGVATKYLNNYLVWHNFLNYAKESYAEKTTIFADFVFTTEKVDLNKSIPLRPALPLVA
ncbi:MAG: IS1595 family transposase, partial [Treponema sp.]|nr:IS1595 family transposase [Treponema sp.]